MVCNCAASWLSPSASRTCCIHLPCLTSEGEVSRTALWCAGLQQLSHRSDAPESRTSSRTLRPRREPGREPLLTLKSSTLFIPSTQGLAGGPEKTPPHPPRVAGAQRQQNLKSPPAITTAVVFSRLTPATSTLSLLGKKGSNFTPSHAETLRQPR